MRAVAEFRGLLNAVALERDEVRVGDTHVGGLQDLVFVGTFADTLDALRVACDLESFSRVPGGRVLIYRESGCSGENATCIFSGELPRFRDGIEDLRVGETVDRKIVDRFMRDGRGWWFVIRSGWEHLVNGTGIRPSLRFILVRLHVSISKAIFADYKNKHCRVIWFQRVVIYFESLILKRECKSRKD